MKIPYPFKTLIIYSDLESDNRYALLEGDYTRFNGVMINSFTRQPYCDECTEWLFDQETGDFKIELSSDENLLRNKEWDDFAFITFLP